MRSKTRRSRSRRFRVAKREYIWATFEAFRIPLTQGGTVFDALFNIVTPTDWARDATNLASREKGAVLQRIVGDVWFHLSTAAGGIAGLRNFTRADLVHGWMKRDIDDLAPVDQALDAFQEDWLQLHLEALDTIFDPTPTLTFWGGPTSVHRAVDIRVKRKLTSDDVIQYLALQTAGAGLQNACDVSVHFRSLIALP